MISVKVQNAINKQIVAELYSSYLYLAMAAYFESVSLKGASSWMKIQAQEELVHATKFFNFVNDRGGRVILGAIDAPPAKWESPLKAFVHANKHEQKVTGLINNLVAIAEKEKDRASVSFLQWYVDEQVEEESSTDDVVKQLKLVQGSKDGMFMIDKELAARVFVYPPPALQPGT